MAIGVALKGKHTNEKEGYLMCFVHKKRDVINKTSVKNRENVSKDPGYIYRSSTR